MVCLFMLDVTWKKATRRRYKKHSGGKLFRCCDISDVVHIWDYVPYFRFCLCAQFILAAAAVDFRLPLFYFVPSNVYTHANGCVCVCCDAAIMYLQKTITEDNKNECTSWRSVACELVCVCEWVDAGGHVASGDDISISSILHRDLLLLVWILVRIFCLF